MAKVDLLYWPHVLRKCGLFENVEMTMPTVHSFDLGDYVNVFQMSHSKGLLFEGRAAVVEKVDDIDERYIVRFTEELDETFERFVDPDGQDDPHQYVLSLIHI